MDDTYINQKEKLDVLKKIKHKLRWQYYAPLIFEYSGICIILCELLDEEKISNQDINYMSELIKTHLKERNKLGAINPYPYHLFTPFQAKHRLRWIKKIIKLVESNQNEWLPLK